MKRLLVWISDLLWPRRCVGCDTGGSLLCAVCRATLPRRPSVSDHPTDHLDRLIAGSRLSSRVASRAVWHLKYRNAYEMAAPLSEWLADCAGSELGARSDMVIVPVPLHADRLRERGYNQAELLARDVARSAALPIDASALSRVRSTASQVGTRGRAERFANMSGAFSALGSVQNRHVVLIDDVSTTGATLEACSAALKEAGARRVTALVVAQG